MEQLRVRFSVLFEDPFWIGLYERESGGVYEICKITFGAEPKETTVYEYLLSHWRGLRFSPAIEAAAMDERRQNPKRALRQARKATQSAGVGTKAQQALKLQQEQGKQERKTRSREQREAEAQRQFELRQEKRLEKHRGH